MTGPLTIYTQPGCRYCREAAQLAFEKGYEVQHVDISIDLEAREMIKDRFDTVPQIYTGDNRHIGGYDDLVAEIARQAVEKNRI